MPEPTLQELDRRLAHLEGWKEAQEKVLLGFKEDLQEIKQRMTAGYQTLEQRMTADKQALEQRMTALEQKMDLQFRWLVGIQLTLLVVVLGVLLGIAFAG